MRFKADLHFNAQPILCHLVHGSQKTKQNAHLLCPFSIWVPLHQIS